MRVVVVFGCGAWMSGNSFGCGRGWRARSRDLRGVAAVGSAGGWSAAWADAGRPAKVDAADGGTARGRSPAVAAVPDLVQGATVPSGSGRPMSRQELADACNTELASMYARQGRRPRWAGLTEKAIGALERGEIRWPNEDYRQALCTVLQTDKRSLGLYIDRPDNAKNGELPDPPQSRILVTSTRGRPSPTHGPTYTSPSRHRPSSRSMPPARPANGVRGCGARSSPATTGRSCCRSVSWKPPYRSATSPTRALSTANCGNYPSSSTGPSPCSPNSQRLWRCPGSPEPPTAFTCWRQNWLPNSVTANSPGPPRTAPDASA